MAPGGGPCKAFLLSQVVENLEYHPMQYLAAATCIKQ